MGGADSAQKSSPTDEENQYTVVDCESSITALEIVQLPLDKQGSHDCILYVVYVELSISPTELYTLYRGGLS